MKKIIFTVFAVVLLVSLVTVPAIAAKKTGNTWGIPRDFATIQDAIDSPDVADGDTIMVGPGTFAGALVDKDVTIMGIGNAVINDGPAHGSGLIQGFRLLDGSDGATISHLRFEADLDIMNGEAVDNVTVEHCTFVDAIQAISNWRGNGWVISHNDIIDLRTRNGGGIGILIGDYSGGTVEDNIVSHNTISGTLHVWGTDGGGYNGSGIVLYADFRWGGAGAEAIQNNSIVQNKVSLVSDTPGVVDVVAFEMTDTRDDANLIVIFDNAIGFNDFRGTVLQIVLTPNELEDENDISRNLGDNRGHGLHPSLFGPGGN
jgi:hypothetical protein